MVFGFYAGFTGYRRVDITVGGIGLKVVKVSEDGN